MVEEGSHDELMAAGRVYADMWQMQQAQVQSMSLIKLANCIGALDFCLCIRIKAGNCSWFPCSLKCCPCERRKNSRRRCAWHQRPGRIFKPVPSPSSPLDDAITRFDGAGL